MKTGAHCDASQDSLVQSDSLIIRELTELLKTADLSAVGSEDGNYTVERLEAWLDELLQKTSTGNGLPAEFRSLEQLPLAVEPTQIEAVIQPFRPPGSE